MKLVVNIPCYNEEQTLPDVLRELPSQLPGIKEIIVQVIDDGSTDKTAEIAEQFGCQIIRHKQNLGLGVAFKHGVENALLLGADIMVNTDADKQYPARYLSDVLHPIIQETADVVIGDRQIWSIAHFPLHKKVLQYLGSASVRWITGTDVPDAVSGFRAYSREALLRLNITTKFSYVIDTIMQCAVKDLKIESVPIRVQAVKRRSRLFCSTFKYIQKTLATMGHVFIIYKPFTFFAILSVLLLCPAIGICLRFIYYYLHHDGTGHILTLLGAGVLFTGGGMLLSLGIVGELLKTNRRLLEEQLILKRRQFYAEQHNAYENRLKNPAQKDSLVRN